MNLRQWILWRPGTALRGVVLLACSGLILLLGYFHYLSGPAYEFHVFFGLPVMIVAWYVGAGAGYGVGILAVALWFVADLRLGGEQADLFALAFNTAIRLAMSAGSVWLLAQMRGVLDREARLAREDTLTSLSNRRAFYERGRDALALARRQATAFTVVFIDLDRFKQVNDELGHEAGDALLRCVAAGFRAHLRAGDIVGRLGGDEFALILPGMDDAAALAYVENLRQRLLAAMRAQGWRVTFSIGVASYRRAPQDFDALLAQADQLMYEVKETGRDRILQRVPDGAAP